MKFTAYETQDNSITDESMHVIWSRGQEHGAYHHRPDSGYERGNAGDATFYKQDELKYHGHGDQRGVTSINFHGELTSGNKHKRCMYRCKYRCRYGCMYRCR